MKFDPDQLEVIEAPVSRRIVVIAGPGAGKTEVACARVTRAIQQGELFPSQVLFVSFTRAATAEVRQRIARHATKDESSYLSGVQVRTIDSLAWSLRRHNPDAKLTGSFSDNIEAAIRLIQSKNDDVLLWLSGLKLIIFDEAQDLIGERSRLAQELIKALPEETGLLVFADPAQRIYGDWATSDTSPWSEEEALDAILLHGSSLGKFTTVNLRGLYRTSVPRLVKIVNDLRPLALEAESAPEESYSLIKEELLSGAAESAKDVPELTAQLVNNPSTTETMILFRTHGEVITLASYLAAEGQSFRLRYPGLPTIVDPWIGRLLCGFEGSRVRLAQFLELWKARIEGTGFDTGQPESAWEALIQVAGGNSYVDLDSLREVISRTNPPDEICAKDVGRGLNIISTVVGTIHGSKGREADRVIVGLAKSDNLQPGDAQEARVLYVAATRARNELQIDELAGLGYLSYVDGRAWKYGRKSGQQQIEFGLTGDVDPLSPVDMNIIGGDAAVSRLQDRFADPSAMKDLNPVSWQKLPEFKWQPRLLSPHNTVIGRPSASFIASLDKITSRLRGNWWPGVRQNHLRVVDFTTVARELSHEDLNRTPSTIAVSGFWVAPVVHGFSMVYATKK